MAKRKYSWGAMIKQGMFIVSFGGRGCLEKNSQQKIDSMKCLFRN
jgi:hypothetical protein